MVSSTAVNLHPPKAPPKLCRAFKKLFLLPSLEQKQFVSLETVSEMSHYDFRRLAEIIPSGKCDPRGVLPLANGLIVVGTFDGSIELYDPTSHDTETEVRFFEF